MKLSNTLIVNETLLPNSKKAFTLAEVLITLSILGVVAALTIPSLVNRQSEMAAIVKLKKAISQYEQFADVYMAENSATDLSGIFVTANKACTDLSSYFKMVDSTEGTTKCAFKTADGVYWTIENSGYAIAYDSKNPKYGVVMWAKGGVANAVTTPTAATVATGSYPAAAALDAGAAPKYYKAASFLKATKPADVKAGGNPGVGGANPAAAI